MKWLYASPDLLQLYALAQGFQRMMTERLIHVLEHWLTQSEKSPFPEFHRFARGLRQDERAVRAALCYSWSNGPTEGHILRLKLIRRHMYGRGVFLLHGLLPLKRVFLEEKDTG